MKETINLIIKQIDEKGVASVHDEIIVHVGKIEGRGTQVQEWPRGEIYGEIIVHGVHLTAGDIPELRDEYRQALAFFDDGQFESPTHRMRCVDHAHELRDMLQALGEDVMSADELSSLIGG